MKGISSVSGFRFVFCISAFQLFGVVAFGQGSLTPPGPPAPTMKTLDQVEARTPVDAVHTPGNDTSQFVITQSGSYYLTGNITGVSGKSGITINANNVTIDLGGFSLEGVPGAVNGIVGGSSEHVRVYNGKVAHWPQYGVALPLHSQADHLFASDNGSDGISAGFGSYVLWCVANDNSANGIVVSQSGLVSHCVADGNNVGVLLFSYSRAESCAANNNDFIGIAYNEACSVADSLANNNGDVQFTGGGIGAVNGGTGAVIRGCVANENVGDGIAAGDGTTISGCTVKGNANNGILINGDAASVTNCTASSNGNANGNGISLNGDNGVVVQCVASNNGTGNNGDGISVHSNCLVEHNNVNANKVVGIRTTGTNNRIDSNLAHGNGSYGISSSGPTADFIIRNTCFGNKGAVTGSTTVDYNPKSGLYFGALAHPGDPTTPSPWANLN